VLRTNYQALAWECTAPVVLSSPGTGAGPSSTQQAFIPSTIEQARFDQQARFDLYLVFHDGSLGGHNGTYAGLQTPGPICWPT
jgi:hypothetical protein